MDFSFFLSERETSVPFLFLFQHDRQKYDFVTFLHNQHYQFQHPFSKEGAYHDEKENYVLCKDVTQ